MKLGISNWIQCLIILLQNLHSPGIGFSCITAEYHRTEHFHSICFFPEMHTCCPTYPRTEVSPSKAIIKFSELLISVAMVAWNQKEKHSFKSGEKIQTKHKYILKSNLWVLIASKP